MDSSLAVREENDIRIAVIGNVDSGKSTLVGVLTKGIMDDGRKINVRPNSSDGRPTLEIQDGKNKTKIRYDD